MTNYPQPINSQTERRMFDRTNKVIIDSPTVEEQIQDLKNNPNNALDGVEIVNELSSLEFADKLQSNDVTYNDMSVKDVLDDLLYINTGSLLVKIYDGSLRANLKFDVISGGTTVLTEFSTTSDKVFSLPSGEYSVMIYPVGYDVLNITVVKDNNPYNNIIGSASNIVNFIDIGFVRSEIIVNVKPSAPPTLYSFDINGGLSGSSTPNLLISPDADGIISEYMISQSPDFNGGQWQSYNGEFNYIYNYVSEVQLTLYLKIKNSIGVSEVKSSSILMLNGISRSDSPKKYNNIDECINDIIDEYGTELTQDVIIDVSQDVYQTGRGRGAGYVFYMTIDDFNLNSDYVLRINGNKKLHIDCRSVGGFKLNFCSNFIFNGINFTNVANNALDYAPEQTCAIFAQGSAETICKNIIVNDCEVNGYTRTTADNYGYYGLIFKYIENVSVLNTKIQGISAFAMDIKNVNALSFSNINITNCHVNYGIVSQPCFINIKATDLLYIEDSIFDMGDFETGIISNNLSRLICKRSSFINSKGEVFRLQNTVDMELLEMDTCVLSNNLSQPHYSWIKQLIAIDTIKVVKFTNNIIRLSEIGGYIYYSSLFRGSEITNYYSYNNIFDFYFPNQTNNKNQAVLINIDKLGYMESDYNVYRDYSTNNDTIINMFINILNNTSPVYFYRAQSLTTLRAKTYDMNSTVISSTQPLFSGTTFTTLTQSVAELPIATGHTITFDRNKNITDTYNVGAYHQIFTSPVVDDVYEYDGIDTYRIIEFSSNQQYITYSKNQLLVIPISNDKGIYFKWIVEDESSETTIYYGVCFAVKLFSKIDIDGKYTGDMNYSIEILKNN